MNSEGLTLVLSRRLAIADGRNQQAAMEHCARQLRASTKCQTSYDALGDFLSAKPVERQQIINVSEGLFLNE